MDHIYHHAGEVKEDWLSHIRSHSPWTFTGVREDKRFLLQELDKSVISDGNDTDAAKQRRYQRFFYQEAFRNLFTSIRFLNSDQPLRTIALPAHFLPKENRWSTCCWLNLRMGQRVLLIDADLRKPQMHLRLGLNNLSGLSNLLADGPQSWREVVQKVPGYTNWSVLTAGCRPLSPGCSAHSV